MARPTGRPAGRPKKQPTFEPPGFKQAVRARFIEYARRHGSAALHLLATDVWRGEMTLDAWAKSFNVGSLRRARLLLLLLGSQYRSWSPYFWKRNVTNLEKP